MEGKKASIIPTPLVLISWSWAFYVYNVNKKFWDHVDFNISEYFFQSNNVFLKTAYSLHKWIDITLWLLLVT